MTDGVDQTARNDIRRVEVTLDKMVPREVYKLGQANQDAEIANIKADNIALEAKVDKQEERALAGRRLLLASFLLPLLIAVILIYVQSQIGAAK